MEALAKEVTMSADFTTDNGAHAKLLDTIHKSRLHLWFADFPIADRPGSLVFTFTFFWK
jgi:hypothetical protein